jgi:hypothetical protein
MRIIQHNQHEQFILNYCKDLIRSDLFSILNLKLIGSQVCFSNFIFKVIGTRIFIRNSMQFLQQSVFRKRFYLVVWLWTPLPLFCKLLSRRLMPHLQVFRRKYRYMNLDSLLISSSKSHG